MQSAAILNQKGRCLEFIEMLRITNIRDTYSIFDTIKLPEEYNVLERDIWDFGNSIIVSNKRSGFKSFESVDRFKLEDTDKHLELYIDIFTDLDGAIAYGDCQRDTREVYQYIINENVIAEKDDRGRETLLVNIKDPWAIKDNDIINIIEGRWGDCDFIGLEEKYVRPMPARAYNKKKQDSKLIKPSIALVLDSNCGDRGRNRHNAQKKYTEKKRLN